MGQAHQLLFDDGEQDVVHTETIEVAGDEALAAERLDDGLVALLADLAVQLEMLYFNLKMCYSVFCFKDPIAPKSLALF